MLLPNLDSKTIMLKYGNWQNLAFAVFTYCRINLLHYLNMAKPNLAIIKYGNIMETIGVL